MRHPEEFESQRFITEQTLKLQISNKYFEKVEKMPVPFWKRARFLAMHEGVLQKVEQKLEFMQFKREKKLVREIYQKEKKLLKKLQQP